MSRLTFVLCAAIALTACTNSSSEMKESKTRSLVVYYSQTGATSQVATLIAEAVGADVDTVKPVNPYTGSFEETIERCKGEFEKGEVPAVEPISKDLAAYDTIYVGYPVWFGKICQPMWGWLKTVDLKGKVVVPFCTFGSGGLNSTTAMFKEAQPGATFIEGYGVRNARVEKAPAEIEKWLVAAGIKEGEAVKLPAFGEQKAVTDSDKAIFDAACGDYPMPMGTPVTVASRAIDGGMEYEFVVDTKDAEGNPAQGRVYVIAGADANAKPEFTHVDR